MKKLLRYALLAIVGVFVLVLLPPAVIFLSGGMVAAEGSHEGYVMQILRDSEGRQIGIEVGNIDKQKGAHTSIRYSLAELKPQPVVDPGMIVIVRYKKNSWCRRGRPTGFTSSPPSITAKTLTSRRKDAKKKDRD